MPVWKDIYVKAKGISKIALPQDLRGFLHRVAKAIEITTIVAIEEIVISAITTTFVTAIVGFGEFSHEDRVALLGVLRSARLCKGTIEGSLLPRRPIGIEIGAN